MPLNWSGTQPIGWNDIEDDAAHRYTLGATNSLLQPNAIRCCVRGCNHWLAKRRRGPSDPNTFCPDHGISVSTSPTYVYRDYRRNFIIDLDILDRVKTLKVESWRLGNERSEDAVSWNVFMALAGMTGLAAAFHHLTAMQADTEPELYLWGIRVLDQQPEVWPKLIAVRRALENGAGIPTEPDIILRVPGQAVVLIEAKFGSANGTMKGQEDRFGAVGEFLDRYPCGENRADPLNRQWIEGQPPEFVLQQLVRNVVFAQWLAEEGELPFVVNLVREADEQNVEDRMTNHLAANGPVRFQRATWESLARLPLLSQQDAAPLRIYLKNKTNNLTRAFAIS